LASEREFHVFGLMPGHGKILWRPKHTPDGGVCISPCAETAISEYNPSSAGVVRRMARSDQCRIDSYANSLTALYIGSALR
jgi:hypothetical protein